MRLDLIKLAIHGHAKVAFVGASFGTRLVLVTQPGLRSCVQLHYEDVKSTGRDKFSAKYSALVIAVFELAILLG